MMATSAPAQRPAREKAVLLQPVVDPAGWRPEEITPDGDWVYRFAEHEIAEIVDTVRAVEASGRPLLEVRAKDFPLPKTAESLRGIYEELKGGRGFVQMRGLPVGELSRLRNAIMLWGIGAYFGRALSQNAEGHMVGHVTDLGKDYNDPSVRAYQTKAAMTFHNDACDMVALLCLNTARSGGESRVCSSIAVYNEMLKRRPELAADLCSDLFWTLHGEASPGQPPWYKMPVFAVTEGVLSVKGASTHARKAQDLPGAERWSETRKEAVDLFQKLAQELAADLPFEQGDLQILNSHVTVHSRRPYEDWDDPARKRHLLSLAPDWTALLRQGLDADDGEAIRAGERTGRPLGAPAFTAMLERRLGRTLARQKPGRKPKDDGRVSNCVLFPELYEQSQALGARLAPPFNARLKKNRLRVRIDKKFMPNIHNKKISPT